ncbi:hypothetical protein ACTSAC_001755 [Campylobacter jejuni]|uniref:hypothetical protein n=1 Tax=Campylobacter vulpis TaxID=1655500 RepID=UPI00128074EF|nr:hypothetical protein [Campylobacter vulpis]EAI8674478.1 hypothetical protein [Campylobacter upsaliensis]EAK8496633.1 hypothetical protein [Campylobacter jejuni]EAJ9123057.1 hypothetical protein [Campylobacter upsaliensis]EAK1457592.1 hypothetical protein [Campylobacter upsaliensis]EAL3918069.1 hypothetical protein [Campylobacter upsaliensis]
MKRYFKSNIHSLRVDKELKMFLDSLTNANRFVIQILKDTQEYKIFKRKLDNLNDKNQPSLF